MVFFGTSAGSDSRLSEGALSGMHFVRSGSDAFEYDRPSAGPAYLRSLAILPHSTP